jgi:hypothetical protein
MPIGEKNGKSVVYHDLPAKMRVYYGLRPAHHRAIAKIAAIASVSGLGIFGSYEVYVALNHAVCVAPKIAAYPQATPTIAAVTVTQLGNDDSTYIITANKSLSNYPITISGHDGQTITTLVTTVKPTPCASWISRLTSAAEATIGGLFPGLFAFAMTLYMRYSQRKLRLRLDAIKLASRQTEIDSVGRKEPVSFFDLWPESKDCLRYVSRDHGNTWQRNLYGNIAIPTNPTYLITKKLDDSGYEVYRERRASVLKLLEDYHARLEAEIKSKQAEFVAKYSASPSYISPPSESNDLHPLDPNRASANAEFIKQSWEQA